MRIYSTFEWSLVNAALMRQSRILRSGTSYVWVPCGACLSSIDQKIRNAVILTGDRSMADLIMRFWPGASVGVMSARQARGLASQAGATFAVVSPWCRGVFSWALASFGAV